MLQKIYELMLGRNGVDRLCIAGFIAAVAFRVAAGFTGVDLLSIPAIILMLYAIFRIFSKNLPKRREENYKFSHLAWTIRSSFSGWRDCMAQSKEYKFFSCPSCKNRLRVPRGKGKLQITCPKCGQRFGGKT